jgi:hypothetical protein
VLQLDAQGYPILPSWEAIKGKGLDYKKLFIGKFMTLMFCKWASVLVVSPITYAHLEIAQGGGKKRIPWARMKEACDDFILPKYLPRNVALNQYHHLHSEDAEALLRHWIHRKATGEVPFQFKKVAKAGKWALTTVPTAVLRTH